MYGRYSQNRLSLHSPPWKEMPWRLVSSHILRRILRVPQPKLSPSQKGPQNGDSFSGKGVIHHVDSGHVERELWFLTKEGGLRVCICRGKGSGEGGLSAWCVKNGCPEKNMSPREDGGVFLQSLCKWSSLWWKLYSVPEALGLMVLGLLFPSGIGDILRWQSLRVIIHFLYIGGSDGHIGELLIR